MTNETRAKQHTRGFSEGDRVTYADINLRHYSGTVTSIGRTQNGGNCLVQWDKFPFVSEECAFNLATVQS